jgi:hypothetical protein
MMREETMPGYRFGLALAIGLFFSTSLARAILIDTGAGKVGGFVLSDDGTTLKINIVTAGGESIGSKEYTRAEIKIIHEVDVKRLERLSKDNPKAYFDYAEELHAEELARQDADPEARARAKELYLIAAKLAQKEFGSKSLLRMSDLAYTEAEARRYRAMAFLLDPTADARILKAEAGGPAKQAQIPPRDLEDFRRALQLYRLGAFEEAEKMVQREGVDKIFSKALPTKLDLKAFLDLCGRAYCHMCSKDGTVACTNCNGKGQCFNKRTGDFEGLCKVCVKGRKRCPACGGKHFSDSVDNRSRRVVLQCELWALDQQGWRDNPRRGEAAGARSWSAVLQSRPPDPVQPLSLDTMIPKFDPKRNLYRNRNWVEK